MQEPMREPWFDIVSGGPNPEKETLAEYLARAAAQGHYCCMCPKQDPPMPCCNAGHAEAVERLRTLEAMEANDA